MHTIKKFVVKTPSNLDISSPARHGSEFLGRALRVVKSTGAKRPWEKATEDAPEETCAEERLDADADGKDELASGSSLRAWPMDRSAHKNRHKCTSHH